MKNIKRILLLSLLLAMGSMLMAQYSQRQVLPGGGGNSSGGTYSNFSVVAEPVVGAITTGTYSGSTFGFLAPFGPVSSTLSGGTTICYGETANLKVDIVSGLSPYTVVYQYGSTQVTVNSYLSGADIPVSPTTTTNYTLVSVHDAAGIPSANVSGSATVTVTPLPTANATNNGPICFGSNGTISTTEVAGATYSWSGPGDFSANTREATVTEAGEYTVTVTKNLCSNTSSTTLVITPQVEAPTLAEVNRNNFCTDDAGNITLSVTGGSGVTLNWSTSINFSSSIGTGNDLVIPSPTTSKTYYARWENSCFESDYVSVTLTVYPLPITTISGAGSVYTGDNLVLTTADEMSSYIWSGAGSPTITNGTQRTASFNWTTAGQYEVTVQYTDGNSCDNTAVKTINVVDPDTEKPEFSCETTSWDGNTTVVITFSEKVFSNADSTGALNVGDFGVVFSKNGGSANGLSINGISHTEGSLVCTLYVAPTSPSSGCEYFRIVPYENQIFDGPGNAMSPFENTTCEYYLPNQQEPTTGATNLTFGSAPSSTSITANWTNGSGNRRLVVMKEGSYPTSIPVDNTIYTVGATYGDFKVIHYGNGTITTATALDLNPSTTYYFRVYEAFDVCNGQVNYKQSNPAQGSKTTNPPATQLAISKINGVDIVAGGSAIVQSGSTFIATVQAKDAMGNLTSPYTDETISLSAVGTLIPNTIQVSGTTIMSKTSSEVTITGTISGDGGNGGALTLRANDNGGGADLVAGDLQLYVLALEPTAQPNSTSFEEVTKDSITIKWVAGNRAANYGRLLVVRRGTNTLVTSQNPVDGNVYNVPTATLTPPSAYWNDGYQIGNTSLVAKTMYATEGANSIDTFELRGVTGGIQWHFRLFEYRYQPGVTQSYNYRLPATSANMRTANPALKTITNMGVNLNSFVAYSANNSVYVNWDTYYEKGISGFEVYRMQSGVDEEFDLVSSYTSNNDIISKGKPSSYKVIDKNNLLIGDVYIYKLVAVAIDGSRYDLGEELVTISSIPTSRDILFLENIHPNPVKDYLKLNFQLGEPSDVTIQIRDLSGKLIGTITENQNFGIGRHTLEFNMNGNAAGSYIISITAGYEAIMQSFIYMP